MNIIRDIYSKYPKQSIVTIGKFDGFHTGHRRLLAALDENKKDGYNKVVISLSFGKEELLSDMEKERVLSAFGIDSLVIAEFDERLKSLSPYDFVKDILIKNFGVKHIVVGDDFRFGYERRGDISTLKELSSEFNFGLTVIPRVTYDGDFISSSRIREALKNGDITLANTLLGEMYGFTGTVMHGKQLGRTIGFPTINLYPDEKKIIPRFGVYSSIVTFDGNDYRGITNIGIRPTLDDGDRLSIETYIADFDNDIYDKTVKLRLDSFIRPEIKFSSVDDLKNQIRLDMETVLHQ